ncbi:hypothetical protein OJ998_15705 [Solirubrobacter taibaiensis]|nr:hypothetical protein [Solirubrobacter taibaiensis]
MAEMLAVRSRYYSRRVAESLWRKCHLSFCTWKPVNGDLVSEASVVPPEEFPYQQTIARRPTVRIHLPECDTGNAVNVGTKDSLQLGSPEVSRLLPETLPKLRPWGIARPPAMRIFKPPQGCGGGLR